MLECKELGLLDLEEHIKLQEDQINALCGKNSVLHFGSVGHKLISKHVSQTEK